jgi:hypothetical protein
VGRSRVAVGLLMAVVMAVVVAIGVVVVAVVVVVVVGMVACVPPLLLLLLQPLFLLSLLVPPLVLLPLHVLDHDAVLLILAVGGVGLRLVTHVGTAREEVGMMSLALSHMGPADWTSNNHHTGLATRTDWSERYALLNQVQVKNALTYREDSLVVHDLRVVVVMMMVILRLSPRLLALVGVMPRCGLDGGVRIRCVGICGGVIKAVHGLVVLVACLAHELVPSLVMVTLGLQHSRQLHIERRRSQWIDTAKYEE